MAIATVVIFSVSKWRGIERPFTFGALLRGEATTKEKFAFFNVLTRSFKGILPVGVALLIFEVAIIVSAKNMSTPQTREWFILILVQVVFLAILLVLAIVGRRGKARLRPELEAEEKNEEKPTGQ